MPPQIALVIDEVDIFQFLDEPFKVRARLVDVATGMTIKNGQQSTIKVLLGFEGSQCSNTDLRCREHHPHLFEVIGNTGLQDNGRSAGRIVHRAYMFTVLMVNFYNLMFITFRHWHH